MGINVRRCLENLRDLKKEIKINIEHEDFNKASNLIELYEKKNFDIDIVIIKSLIEFNKGNLDLAEYILLEVYNKFQFNFEVNYNLGMINVYKNKFNKAINYLVKSMLLDKTKKDLVSDTIRILLENEKNLNKFEELRVKAIDELENYSKKFPKFNEKKTFIGKAISNKSERFYCGIYDNYAPIKDKIFLEDVLDGQNLFKCEILKGKKIKSRKFTVDKKAIIPIMKLKYSSLSLNVGDIVYDLTRNLPNRYYYYLVDQHEEISVSSKEEFILGESIELGVNKDKPKLVLNLFVDGLSQEIIKDNNLEKYMPNVYSFFEDGIISNNTYVTGEWTYVSLASIFTGKYTTNHRIYHPKYDTKILFDYELYTEILKNNKYFCSKIDGNWRTTPSVGYIKGMDRTIYQPNIRGMYSKDIIGEIIEHLEMFKDKNNFLWTCIFDLHDISDELEIGHISQSICKLENRFEDITGETSVRKKYNGIKSEKYKLKLKEIDTYLGLLFSYINDKYSKDEYVISLFSDHGQGYILNDTEFLGDQRTKIPFMIKGKGIPKGQCNELISSLDIFPTILKCIGINDYNIKDGNLPKYFGGNSERKYTITESIFPQSPYRAVINDCVHSFFFETYEPCSEDGRIIVDNYKVKLINKITKNDEVNLYKEKIREYTKVILNHIKDYVII